MGARGQVEFTERKRQVGEPMILAGSTVGGEQGTFSVDFRLWDMEWTKSLSLNGLVDTRAIFTHIPEDVLGKLGIEKWQDRDFHQRDGTKESRPVGLAKIELAGKVRTIEVVVETAGSPIVIGRIALTCSALAADATRGRLLPGELTL